MTISSWYRFAALGALLSLSLLVAGPLHLEDESPSGDHCATCHLRHVSAVESSSTPAPAAPAAIGKSFVPGTRQGESDSYLRLPLSRGPPT